MPRSRQRGGRGIRRSRAGGSANAVCRALTLSGSTRLFERYRAARLIP